MGGGPESFPRLEDLPLVQQMKPFSIMDQRLEIVGVNGRHRFPDRIGQVLLSEPQ